MGKEIPVSSTVNVSALPLHVVFLLEDAAHQKALMHLAIDYVTQLAENLRNAEITYIVLTAGKNQQVVAEGGSSSDLVAEIKKADLIHRSDSNDSGGLYDGAAQVVNILDHSLGDSHHPRFPG